MCYSYKFHCLWLCGCNTHVFRRYVNSEWPTPEMHSPFSHSHLHSLSPPSFKFGRGRSKVSFGRDAFLCHCHLSLVPLLFPPLISPLPQFASGANITARYWSLLTPHELNMDKHILQLTGRLLWRAGFTEASGHHFISSQLSLACFGWSRKMHKMFRGGITSNCAALGSLCKPCNSYMCGMYTVCACVCAPHLWEELIVIILQDPHFRLQLSDVVGGGIWRRDGEEKRGSRLG